MQQACCELHDPSQGTNLVQNLQITQNGGDEEEKGKKGGEDKDNRHNQQSSALQYLRSSRLAPIPLVLDLSKRILGEEGGRVIGESLRYNFSSLSSFHLINHPSCLIKNQLFYSTNIVVLSNYATEKFTRFLLGLRSVSCFYRGRIQIWRLS